MCTFELVGDFVLVGRRKRSRSNSLFSSYQLRTWEITLNKCISIHSHASIWHPFHPCETKHIHQKLFWKMFALTVWLLNIRRWLSKQLHEIFQWLWLIIINKMSFWWRWKAGFYSFCASIIWNSKNDIGILMRKIMKGRAMEDWQTNFEVQCKLGCSHYKAASKCWLDLWVLCSGRLKKLSFLYQL